MMKAKFGLLLVCVVAMAAAVMMFVKSHNANPAVSAITRDGVISEVQALSQLHSVAFSVDTVITATKEGTWQRLWQDEQKGLFVANGRVLAGVDLSKIGAEMVQVRYAEQPNPKVPPVAHITISVPPSEVFEVYLDNIQVYDWQTGVFGLMDNDPKILDTAQTQGKLEVLKRACAGDVMQLASDNAVKQVEALFALTGAKVTVISQGVGACRL